MQKTKEMCLCAFFTALICAGAFIKIPTPFLPITFQTLFVTLAGLILGSKKGALSVSIYVLIGLMGLPVFTEGGGIYYVLKPAFGYLLGFIAGAFVTGRIAKKETSLKNYVLSSFAGMLVIYIIGIVYYFLISRFYLGVNIEVRELLVYCFLLTLPGEVVMCILASVIGKRLKKVLKQI